MALHWNSIWILKDDLRTWVASKDAYDFVQEKRPDLLSRPFRKGSAVLWFERKEIIDDAEVMRVLEKAFPKRVSLRDVRVVTTVKKGGAIRGGAATINSPAPPYEKVQFTGFKVKPDTKKVYWTVSKEGSPHIISKIKEGRMDGVFGALVILLEDNNDFTDGDTVLLKGPASGAVVHKLQIENALPDALIFGTPVTVAPFDDVTVVDDVDPIAGYNGLNAPRTDMEDRALIMKNAIKAAYGVADKSAKILKIFMAPEFYWRNADGAYPLEVIPDILIRMSEETRKDDYKDWLFVLGTAIGYIPHEERAGETRKYVFTVTGITGTKISVCRTGQDTKPPVDYPKAETNVTVTVWERIPEGTAFPWKIHQGLASGEVTKVTRETKATMSVEFNVTAGAFAVGQVVLEEPLAAELLNVALVQKGGADTEGRGGLREAVVYKELASHIDFLNDTPKEWYEKTGKHRKIRLEWEDQVMLPTEGAVDVLSPRRQPANRGDTGPRVSEVNLSGYGGGGVLTIDGITFGVEVCRDHLKKRLQTYYFGDSTATPAVVPAVGKREPRVQVQLIPSWGAWIDRKAVCCVDNGLVFNVDGAKILTAARIWERPGTYSCEKHPTNTAPAECACSFCRFDNKYCTVCKKFPASNCSCSPKRAFSSTWPDLYYCETCKRIRLKPLAAPTCFTCSAAITPYHEKFRLTAFGNEITTIQKDIAVDAGGKKWTDYFSGPGLVDIYEPKVIPPPQKAG